MLFLTEPLKVQKAESAQNALNGFENREIAKLQEQLHDKTLEVGELNG